MNAWTTWVALLQGADNVLLPAAQPLQIFMRVSWAVVLAWLGFWVVFRAGLWMLRTPEPRTSRRWAILLALGATALTLSPGEYSPAFWLGLAFQSPSLMTVAYCGYWIVKSVGSAAPRSLWAVPALPTPWSLYWLVSGAAGGAVLLADTFALLPMSLYALGFGPLAATVVFGWASLPLAFAGIRGRDALMWLAPLVVAVFVVTRWPTGNVWDAVLDPLLWGVVCIALVRRLIRGR